MPAMGPSEIGGWFEQEAARLVLYARRWSGRAEAEEVVQEAFMRLLRQDRLPGQVRGWLYATVRNLSISRLRSSARRRAREEASGQSASAWFEDDPGGLIDGRAAQRALAALPDDEREVVLLRVWGGMTLQEVGQIVGASIPTVFRRYQSALGRLRQEMEAPCRHTAT